MPPGVGREAPSDSLEFLLTTGPGHLLEALKPSAYSGALSFLFHSLQISYHDLSDAPDVQAKNYLSPRCQAPILLRRWGIQVTAQARRGSRRGSSCCCCWFCRNKTKKGNTPLKREFLFTNPKHSYLWTGEDDDVRRYFFFFI